jgi:site-specific DNA recombinase
VRVIVDNSVGASRHSRGTRHGYADLKGALVAGECDVVVAWEGSRFQRDLKAYAELADLCRTHRVLYSYSGRVLDLDDPNDAFDAGLDALLAEREAGVTSKRVRRNMRANAAAGKPHGRVQYGYTRVYDERTGNLVGQVECKTTGPVVRYIFEQLAAGRSSLDLAVELNERGLLTRKGNAWGTSRLRELVVDHGQNYLGRRVHHGEVVVEGAWPALIDERTYELALARMLARSRAGHDTSAKHLLSGILTCGKCGGFVGVDPRKSTGGIPRYVCKGSSHAASRVAGCVTRKQETVDQGVERLVAAFLSLPDVLARVSANRDDKLVEQTAQLKALRDRLQAAEDAALADDARPAAAALYAKLEAKLGPQIAELAAATDATRADVEPELLAVVESPDPVAAWNALADRLDVRRIIVRALFDSLRLMPSDLPRGAHRTGEVQVEYLWRNAAAPELLGNISGD